jgi:hypothetical protein
MRQRGGKRVIGTERSYRLVLESVIAQKTDFHLHLQVDILPTLLSKSTSRFARNRQSAFPAVAVLERAKVS